MVTNLLSQDSTSEPNEVYERREILQKNYYFDNETVERLMYQYLEGACTDVNLRDQIMVHSNELIEQTIKAHNLAQIYPGRDESSYGDLKQVAWMQIENALYKFEAFPHCSNCYNNQRPNDSLLVDSFVFVEELIELIKKCPKCQSKLTRDGIYYRGKSKLFNMWSQIARTVILAYIKKENRDRKNSPVFQNHLENKTPSKNHTLDRFLSEAEEICKNNRDFLSILSAIRDLYVEDDKPHEGLITKLVERTGVQRKTVTDFLKMMRLRQEEFTDSPINEEVHRRRQIDDQDSEDGANE